MYRYILWLKLWLSYKGEATNMYRYILQLNFVQVIK